MLTTPAPSSGDDIPIDVDLIKVLASDTRRDVLRLLGERRHTLSELAEALGLKKATILEHLEKLTAAELVRRIDDGERIWVYYELTRRGNRLVHPERTTRFYLIMAGSVAAVVILGAIVALAMLPGNDLASSPEMRASEEGLLVGDDLSAATPLVVYRGFDDGVPIAIEGGAPDGATLLVAGRELGVSDGRAMLAAADVDALPEGRHPMTLRTDAGDLPLRAALDVREPPVAIAPLVVAQDATTEVLLSVGAPGLPTPSNLTVLVDGEPVPLTLTASGMSFAVSPGRADAVDVRVGRLARQDVRVVPDLAFEAADDNGTLALRVLDAAGPLAGALVALDGATLGTTDADGALRAAWPAEGEHALSIAAADGRVVERAVAARDATLLEIAPRLELAAYADPGVPTLAALVDVTNRGVVNETVTLVARLDGTPIASARVDAAPGSRAEARLVANVPLTAPVTIEAYGARAAAGPWFAARAFDVDEQENASAGGAAAPAAPAASPPVTHAEAMELRASKSTLAGRAPDATFTLQPLAAPTVAPSAAAEDAAAPAVPFATPALVLAIVVAVAVLMRRGRDRR